MDSTAALVTPKSLCADFVAHRRCVGAELRSHFQAKVEGWPLVHESNARTEMLKSNLHVQIVYYSMTHEIVISQGANRSHFLVI
jgi:hypothetical protein